MAVVTATYTSPLSATLDKSTGAVFDEAQSDALAGNDLVTHGTVGYIGCRAVTTGTQSITTGTPTALQYGGTDTFDSDPNGAMHDPASNPTRVTIRTAGVYNLSAWTQWAGSATTGYRESGFRVNGAALVTDRRPALNTSETAEFLISHSYLFAANDYVEVWVAHSQGSSLTVNNGALSVIKA